MKKLINSKLENYVDSLIASFDEVSEQRQLILLRLTEYITTKLNAGEPINLIFICTHNSRRSHFAQIWAQVASYYYVLSDKVFTYSGGTEATAFNLNAVRAIEESGVEVIIAEKGDNPIYKLLYNESEPAIEAFSKVYFDPYNPKTGFAAVMTCSDADDNCPFIPGAEARVSTTYEDPKKFDGTELQDPKYAERCREIAREMFWAFSKV
jgi:arsenate reductase (thioredoxin)